MSDSGNHKGVFPQWMRGILLLAATYNFAWGLFIAAFPETYYEWIKGEQITMGPLVQYQGMGILIFGILYLIAAFNPLRFRFFVLAGLLSKLVGALLLYYHIMDKTQNARMWFHLFSHDLVWTIPLGMIFIRAIKIHFIGHGMK